MRTFVLVSKAAVVTLVALALGGCSAWNTYVGTPAYLLQRAPRPALVRVLTRSGDLIVIQHPEVRGDSVYGFAVQRRHGSPEAVFAPSVRESTAVALSDITVLETPASAKLERGVIAGTAAAGIGMSAAVLALVLLTAVGGILATVLR